MKMEQIFMTHKKGKRVLIMALVFLCMAFNGIVATAAIIPLSSITATLNGKPITTIGEPFPDTTPAVFAMNLSWTSQQVSAGDYFQLKISAQAVLPGSPANEIDIINGSITMHVSILGTGSGGLSAYTDDPTNYPNGYYLIKGTITSAPAGLTNFSGTYAYTATIQNWGGGAGSPIRITVSNVNGSTLTDFTVQPGAGDLPDSKNQKDGTVATAPTDLKAYNGQPYATFTRWKSSLNIWQNSGGLAYYDLQNGIVTDTIGPGQAFIAADLQQQIINNAAINFNGYGGPYPADVGGATAFIKIGPRLGDGSEFPASYWLPLIYGSDPSWQDGTPPPLPAGTNHAGKDYGAAKGQTDVTFYYIPMNIVTSPINPATAKPGDVYIVSSQVMQIYLGNVGKNIVSIQYYVRVTDTTPVKYTNNIEINDLSFSTGPVQSTVTNTMATGTITASNAPTIVLTVGKDDSPANQGLHPSSDPYNATGSFTYANTVTLNPNGGGSSPAT